VTPGFPAFRVINFSSVKAVAEVAEAYAPKIKVNDDCIIYFPDLGKEIQAKLSFSSRYINPVNRTFVVESRLEPNGHNYRANMIAIMKINDYKAENALVIPINIIQSSMEGKYVYVVREENNKRIAKKQKVTLGLTYNGLAEVQQGLVAGDRVITTGYQDLKDGQQVSF
jgi:multidrug efflux pump subunit AcrA (membrane-fusion protein)